MFEALALPQSQRDTTPIRIATSHDDSNNKASHVFGGLHAGGLVIPMLADKPRLNKPPIIYWLQATSAAICSRGDPNRDAIWMYRIPSAIAAIIAVLATWRIGLTMFNPRAAWLAAAMLGVAAVVVVDAHQARADQALLAITTITMGLLWKAWRSDRPTLRTCALLWLLVGVGVLTKGPITPMLVLLTATTAAAWTRRWKWLLQLRPALGLLIVAAVVAPWVWGVASRVGFENYASIVIDETLGRSASAKEGHWGPPGYHTVLLVALLWPGSLLALLSIRRAWNRSIGPIENTTTNTTHPALPKRFWQSLTRQRIGRSPELFLLSWILPAWLVFELISTKLPHYTLPMYPAVALLSARAVLAAATGRLIGTNDRGSSAGFVIWALVGIGVACAGLAAVWFADLGSTGASILAWLLAITTYILAAVAGNHAIRRRFIKATATAIAMHVTLAWTILGVVLPRASEIWITEQIAAAVGDHPHHIATTNFTEDSLVFLARGRLHRIPATDPDSASRWLNDHQNAALIIQAEEARTFIEGLIAHDHPHTLTPIEAFNYASGRLVRLVIIQNQTTAQPEPAR